MYIDKRSVGQRILNIRNQGGYTMKQFGELVGDAPKGTVNGWEKGGNLPNKERMEKIAVLGNMSVEELLYGDFQTYVHQLLPSKFPKELESALVKQLQRAKIIYYEDVEILKFAQRFMDTYKNGSGSDQPIQYEEWEKRDKVYVAYGADSLKAFVHMDENNVFHFMPVPCEDYSLSKIAEYLLDGQAYRIVTRALEDFSPDESFRPTILLYDVDSVEIEMQIRYFKYDAEIEEYKQIQDDQHATAIQTYLPFVREMQKEVHYHDVELQL